MSRATAPLRARSAREAVLIVETGAAWHVSTDRRKAMRTAPELMRVRVSEPANRWQVHSVTLVAGAEQQLRAKGGAVWRRMGVSPFLAVPSGHVQYSACVARTRVVQYLGMGDEIFVPQALVTRKWLRRRSATSTPLGAASRWGTCTGSRSTRAPSRS